MRANKLETERGKKKFKNSGRGNNVMTALNPGDGAGRSASVGVTGGRRASRGVHGPVPARPSSIWVGSVLLLCSKYVCASGFWRFCELARCPPWFDAGGCLEKLISYYVFFSLYLSDLSCFCEIVTKPQTNSTISEVTMGIFNLAKCGNNVRIWTVVLKGFYGKGAGADSTDALLL